MTELDKYKLVNNCSSIEDLQKAILLCSDINGLIPYGSELWHAGVMAARVRPVVYGEISASFLTKEYGIR